MQKLAVALDGGDHAGHYVVAAEQAVDFGLDASPDARGELPQQLAIKASMHSQTLGQGQHNLAVRHGKADLFGHVQGGQQGAFLVAGGTRAALLAGKGHEHLVLALPAANASKALLEIAAPQKGGHGTFHDGPPIAILGRKPLVVDLLEGLEMLVHQTPQIRGLRITWTVQAQRLDTGRRRDEHGSPPR